MIKQKKLNFKIASLIAMIFMGLFIAFANSSVVFANNEIKLKMDIDGVEYLFSDNVRQIFISSDEIEIEYVNDDIEYEYIDEGSMVYIDFDGLTITHLKVYDFDDNNIVDDKIFLDDLGTNLTYTLNADWIGKVQFETTQEYETIAIHINFSSELKPAISGEHTVIANVDNPYTIDRIKQIADLTATDAYYGDITNDIEVIRDEYTENSNRVGDYEVEFKVTNDSNLSANFILIVSVKDLTAPVITGKATSTVSYTEQFDINNLLATYTVTDNHDQTIKLKVDSNDYSGDKIGQVGIYQIKLSATDSSGNKATVVHTLTVVDDVKPKIVDEHTGPISINWRDRIDNNFLLMGLTAEDEIDGVLTDKITIIENNVKNELGTYTVKYRVEDKAGNFITYTRTYKVITTDAPIFWVSKNLLLISEVNALSNQQLADELAKYEGIKMASFAMVYDEYTGNEDVPGEYQVKIAIADTEGREHQVSRTIRVFAEEDLPEVQPTFFEKVINFFKSIWNLIVKIFNWIINAIKWLYKLIFGWIN